VRDTAGWHAQIAFLDADGEPPGVAFLCPACAELELDED
jgi:hypothetical protein